MNQTAGKSARTVAMQQLVQDAQAHIQQGRLAQGEAACRSLLEQEPGQANALIMLSVVYSKRQQWDEALAVLHEGARLHPEMIGFHVNLGKIYMLLGREGHAAASLQKAVLMAPDDRALRVSLVKAYNVTKFDSFSADAKRAMTMCLQDSTLPHRFLAGSWYSLFAVDPAMEGLRKLFAPPDYESFRTAVSADTLRPLLQDEFLLWGLRRLLFNAMEMEQGLMRLRRWFLERGAEDVSLLEDFHPFLCALGRYCFFTEYIFQTDDSEELLLERLQDYSDSMPYVALLGCYGPLFRCKDVESILALARQSKDRNFRDLIRIQVEEPLKEEEIKETIPVLGQIDNDVSRKVQSQYEENPYPRWATVGIGVVPESVQERARGKKILIAGCGTGHESSELAMMFPYAEVTAVDLSRSSLAYAIRKAQEFRIKNIKFMQGDIHDLGILGGPFDLVSCCGVLHHMQYPMAGWRVLAGLLAPGGVMKIALYSTMARRAIAACHRQIAEKGFSATPQGIRDYRTWLMAQGEECALEKSPARSFDFYSLSMCRDLLFHVQEHTYTLPQIADMAQDLGLSFRGMGFLQGMQGDMFLKMFPEKGADNDLMKWHEFEIRYPDTFAAMYTMWFCRSGEENTADFSWVRGIVRI